MVEVFSLCLVKVFSSLDVPLGTSSPFAFHRLCKLLHGTVRYTGIFQRKVGFLMVQVFDHLFLYAHSWFPAVVYQHYWLHGERSVTLLWTGIP